MGNMYAFTGADIYGRFKRMQGYDVFEPIGLDGFGIHSENYAIKVGKHPAEQAKISEKNFYRQLQMLGNGFAWNERLETYDPEYYKWTQWIFIQMFKRGLAYRKKAAVNWCPSCKTVLADEQVIQKKQEARIKNQGKTVSVCERCETEVVKKELEQWFLRITNYADRLLKNLEKIDWSERIKIAQRNWIGKSEGAKIEFPLTLNKDTNFLILHGYTGRADKNFIPWLKRELESRGFEVHAPQLPNTDLPKESEQVGYVLKKCRMDEHTIVIGHSLGGAVAMKALQKINRPIAGLVLVAPTVEPRFRTGAERPFWKTFSLDYDYKKIKKLSGFRAIISDTLEKDKRGAYLEYLSQRISASLYETKAGRVHFTSNKEPFVLEHLSAPITVFTTRPDTIFGATYLVLSPEYPFVENHKSQITNHKEAEAYIKKAESKTEEERITEGREKTGVELKGIKAINPANGEEISIWVADYVLGGVGTGAIMAVPAHDERDFEFAQKYNLPIRMVVCPHYPEPTCPVLDNAYIGVGHLVDSGKFSGMDSESAKWEITKFVGGKKTSQYRLRDWLISRQRYWGPPIPMIYCEKCGWQPVPEKDLPVKLPYVKNFRPTGTEKSPLATVEKFWKVRCPKCGSAARRETDVSDTFLDSAWYYLGYLLGTKSEKRKAKNYNAKLKTLPIEKSILKRWLPVDMYIGGAEHAVLHLLYVRFLAMALHDIGVLNFPAQGGSASGREEPFKHFRAHGLIIKDGAKMSKSKGNIVNPDDYIRAYGADALRMYLMFLGPFEQGGDFRDSGMKGITRFLERAWKFANQVILSAKPEGSRDSSPTAQNDNLKRLIHKTIKKVTEDIEGLQYNTAVSALMVLLNEFEEHRDSVMYEDVKIFLKLLAPFAPHLTEELWQKLQKQKKFASIHTEPWPKYNLKLLKEDTFELVIQINGKVRGRATLAVGASEAEAKKAALALPQVKQYISGEPKKVIFVPNKLINFVV